MEKALYYYQQALIVLTVDFDNSDIYTNPSIQNIVSKPVLLQALTKKAQALFRLYDKNNQNLKDLQFSLNTYQFAVKVIDIMRYEHTTESAIRSLTSNSMGIYEGAIQVANKLYQTAGKTSYFNHAFTLTEKSKAFLLQQTLRESRALQFANIPDSLVQLENKLKAELSLYSKKLFKAQNRSDSIKIALYQNERFERKQQFDTLIHTLETNYPQYYALKYVTKTPTVQEIQRQLPDGGTTFVEYFTGDSTSYAFVIQKNNFQIIELANDSTLEASVTALRENITKQGNKVSYVQTAHRLWQQLIEPLEDVLKNGKGHHSNVGKNSQIVRRLDPGDSPRHVGRNDGKVFETSRLIIVPHGALHYLPFEALLIQHPSAGRHGVDTIGINFTKLRYLLYDYNISYASSASLWLKAKQAQIDTETTCLAFAPQYSGDSVTSRGTLDILRGEALSELPGAMDEVRALANYTDGNFFIGQEATEANFKKYAPSASIIHLAMHALLDSEYPEGSRFVFTHEQDTVEDDSLFVYELYNMDLPSQLVVLSACNSGTGQLARGEGLLSLARAFMYAGSPNLVMSHWNVNDATSAKLMDHFYAGLAKGLTKDVALREAKLHYLSEADENFAHPFFWASMAPMGNMDPVHLEKRSVWWMWLLVGLGTIALGGIVVWRVRR